MNSFHPTDKKAPPIHIGDKITELLEARHMTKRELGERIGVSASNAVHLTTRNSVDVRLLQRVGNALRYNFWKHFPIDDGSESRENTLITKDIQIAALERKVAELQKQIDALQLEAEPLRNEMRLLKLENDYLRDFAEFVKGAFGQSKARLRRGLGRKGLDEGERLMIDEGK